MAQGERTHSLSAVPTLYTMNIVGHILLLLPLATITMTAEDVQHRAKRQLSSGEACMQIYTVPKQTVKCQPSDDVVNEFSSVHSILNDLKKSMENVNTRIDELDPNIPKDLPAEVLEKLAVIDEVKITQTAHTEVLERIESEMGHLLKRVETVEANERAEVAKLISLQTELISAAMENANISIHDEYIARLADNTRDLTQKLRELEENIRDKIEKTAEVFRTEVNQAEDTAMALVENLNQRMNDSGLIWRENFLREQEERAKQDTEINETTEELRLLQTTVHSLKEELTGKTAGETQLNQVLSECKAKTDELKEQMDMVLGMVRKQQHLVPRILKVQDCQEALVYYQPVSGVYSIYPTPSTEPLLVYCDMRENEGWTVILRRQDGSEDFFKGWQDYRVGFGDPEMEYWIGLEKIHYLTNRMKYKLRVDVQDWEDKWYYAEYDTFYIDSEDDMFALHVDGYQGDAGDSLSFHNNAPFSTMDKNNDENNGICATWCHGAWWYKDCFHSNLAGRYYSNGPYITKTGWGDGMVWRSIMKSNFYSLKTAIMKIMPLHAVQETATLKTV